MYPVPPKLTPPAGDPETMPAGVLAEAVYEQGSAWPPTISADPERARLIRHVRRVACFKELERQIAFEGIGGALSNTNPHDLRDALDCCAAIDRPDLVELLERAKDCDEEDAGETMHAEW